MELYPLWWAIREIIWRFLARLAAAVSMRSIVR